MIRMSRPTRISRPGAARARLLLVLATLAGILAMHGLGPDATASTGSASASAATHAVDASHPRTVVATRAAAPAHGSGVHAAPQSAHGSDDAHAATVAPSAPAGHDTGCALPGDEDGHADHADGTCAAPGTAAGPVLPGLVPAPLGDVEVPAPSGRSVPEQGDRGPPALSELQLLRI